MSGRYQARAVKRAFQILELVCRSEQGLTLSDLSRQLEISKSTVHGIAAALEDTGAVVRDPRSRRYAPGLTLFKLGRAAYSRITLRDVARPYIEELGERTEESVFLGVRHGERVFILDIVESMQDLKITSPVGTRIPLLAGAAGKVFLSCMTDEKAERIVRERGLVRFTDNTVTDPERYLMQVREVRARGYATDDEEYIAGVRAVASPIVAEDGLASAIWVVGFKTRMDARKMKLVTRETRRAALEIGRARDAA